MFTAKSHYLSRDVIRNDGMRQIFFDRPRSFGRLSVNGSHRAARHIDLEGYAVPRKYVVPFGTLDRDSERTAVIFVRRDQENGGTKRVTAQQQKRINHETFAREKTPISKGSDNRGHVRPFLTGQSLSRRPL